MIILKEETASANIANFERIVRMFNVLAAELNFLIIDLGFEYILEAFDSSNIKPGSKTDIVNKRLNKIKPEISKLEFTSEHFKFNHPESVSEYARGLKDCRRSIKIIQSAYKDIWSKGEITSGVYLDGVKNIEIVKKILFTSAVKINSAVDDLQERINDFNKVNAPIALPSLYKPPKYMFKIMYDGKPVK